MKISLLITAITLTFGTTAYSSAINEEANLPHENNIIQNANLILTDAPEVLDVIDIVKGCANHQDEQNFAQKILNAKIKRITEKYPSLKRGVSAMKNLYDCGIPEGTYDFRSKRWLRNLVFGSQVSIFAASEVIKCLSIFNPDETLYGKILTGLYMAKAGIWTYSNYLEKQDADFARGIMLDFSTKDEANQNTSEYFKPDISKATRTAKKISNVIINSIKNTQLDETDNLRFQRLVTINNELRKNSVLRNVFFYGGKILSTIMNVAVGFSTSISGQESKPSYWLTLSSTAIDSFFEDIEKYFDKKSPSQEYMLTSELIFLCSYFSSKILDSETV